MRWPAWATVPLQQIRQRPFLPLIAGAATIWLALLTSPVANELSADVGLPAFYPVLGGYFALSLLGFSVAALLCLRGAQQPWTRIGRGALGQIVLLETAFASLHLAATLSTGAPAVGMEVVAGLGAAFGQLAMVEAALHPEMRIGESFSRAVALVRREWRALLLLLVGTVVAAGLSLLTLGLGLVLVVPWYYLALVQIAKLPIPTNSVPEAHQGARP